MPPPPLPNDGKADDITSFSLRGIARCFGCGVAGYPGDRYCACCGRPLNSTCRHCGAEIMHPVANYCASCGGALGGER